MGLFFHLHWRKEQTHQKKLWQPKRCRKGAERRTQNAILQNALINAAVWRFDDAIVLDSLVVIIATIWW